jgi:UDP-glucose 4-epimerase
MKITVWGGSGFLGSHVCDVLTKSGHDVTVADIIESPWLKDNQKMFLGDITDIKAVIKSTKNSNIVYNFAGVADIGQANDNPISTVEQNIRGNLNILEAAIENKINRYIFASTVYVYSQSGGFYRCSKQACELYIEEYYKKYNLNYSILRFGTLYGPRSDNKNSIYYFIKQILQNKKINYDGKANSIREYIHVLDAAKVCLDIIDEKYTNQHFVITGAQPKKVKNTIKMIAEILKKEQLNISFEQGNNSHHYEFTPYSYSPKVGRKFTLPVHIDFGQGIIQLVEQITNELEKER